MKPDPQTMRQLLDDVEAVTKSRFHEDPEPWCSDIEMFRIPAGQPGGEPFAALSAREKLQVLGHYTPWPDYEKRGVSFEQMEQVFANVLDGKPRERWLEGTSQEDLAKSREARQQLMADAHRLAAQLFTPASPSTNATHDTQPQPPRSRGH
jgi:hypothetical protein